MPSQVLDTPKMNGLCGALANHGPRWEHPDVSAPDLTSEMMDLFQDSGAEKNTTILLGAGASPGFDPQRPLHRSPCTGAPRIPYINLMSFIYR